MSPLVSIITVTFNCAGTLAKTLDSVRACKASNVEYVVVDGESTDGTFAMLEANRDIIDVLISEPDEGIYDAMNKAVVHATGDYVIFLNGDDQFIPAAFVQAVGQLPRDAECIESFTTHVGSASEPDEVLTASPWRLLLFNSVPHPSTFIPRSVQVAFQFDTSYRIAADYDLFLRAWVKGVRVRPHTLPIAVHHRGGASADASMSEHELSRIQRRVLPPHLQVPSALHRRLRDLLR